MSPDSLPSGGVGDPDLHNDLPPGWAWAALGDVFPLEYGKALPERARDQGGDISVYGSSGVVGRHSEAIVAGPAVIVGRKGSAGAVFYSEERCLPIDTVYFVRPQGAIHLRYGYYFLKWRNLGRLDQSTAIPSLARERYSPVRIPVAPLAEQGRIVARIDELFAEIAEGEAALARSRRDLDTWRRALLKAAVTGELTREWRKSDQPTETSRDLLASIQDCRLRAPGRRQRRSGSAEPRNPTTLGELPKGWAWGRLGDLGEIVGGVTVDQKRKPLNPVEVSYLRVANVQRGHLDLTEVKTIRVEQNIAVRLELKPGDVLLNEGGDRDKIGRGWVWEGKVPGCIHQNHIFRVRPHHGINPYLVSYYANEMGRGFFIEKGKQTTNLASISYQRSVSFRCRFLPQLKRRRLWID
jgi:restriction endonuclease S subunit